MLTTGIPAFSAFWATGVSAAPSCGRITSASGFCAIACSTCCACESASAACSSENLTSSWDAAAAFAFFEMAPSQPWSVGGTLAMMLTVLPVPSEPLAGVPLAAGAVCVTVLVEPPHAATPIASSETAAIEMMSRLSDIAYLLLGLSPSVQRLRPSVPRLRTLKQDCAEDDQALGHLLYLGRKIELRHQAEDEREGEYAQEGADDRRAAAGQARAADDHRADRVELVEVAADGRRAAEARTEQHRRDAGEQAGQHVDAEDDLA